MILVPSVRNDAIIPVHAMFKTCLAAGPIRPSSICTIVGIGISIARIPLAIPPPSTLFPRFPRAPATAPPMPDNAPVIIAGNCWNALLSFPPRLLTICPTGVASIIRPIVPGISLKALLKPVITYV